MRERLLYGFLLLAVSTTARGQMCNGTASFSSGPFAIGADAGFGQNAKSFSAGLTVGKPNSVFGGATVGTVNYDGGGSSSAVGATVGVEVPSTPSGKLSLCPIVSLGHLSGPNIDTGLGTAKLSSTAYGGGLSLGGSTTLTPTIDLVPFVSFQYFGQSVTIEDNTGSSTATTSYGVIDVGFGFVVNHTLTVQPSVSIPVGLDGGSASFGIGMRVNLGK